MECGRRGDGAGGTFRSAEVVLFLWLVGAVEPHRVAARYLVAPLLTVIEGYVLLRPDSICGRSEG